MRSARELRTIVTERRGLRGHFGVCTALMAVAAFVPLAMSAPVGASDAPGQLDVGAVFTNVSQMEDVATVSGPTSIRGRIAVVDLAKLSEVGNAGAGRLTLNLFDDATVAATVERSTPRAADYSLGGRLDDIEQLVHGLGLLNVPDDPYGGDAHLHLKVMLTDD